MTELCFFNIKDGFAEGICRGFRSGFLTQEDYKKIGHCDTLEDLRSVLEDTDYGNFLQDEPSPIAVTTIGSRCREKIAAEFRYLRAQANEPLNTFLDFIAREKMIDNVIGLIQGTINKKPATELLSRLDPMGWFPEMRAITAMDFTSSYDDLYKTLLIDTPVGPYFERFLEATQSFNTETRSMEEVVSIFSETDIELMRNTLKKAWLEDFYNFVEKIGGTTKEFMSHALKCEADFRVLLVTLNSINRNLVGTAQLQDRNALYPSFGYLYPEGTDRIRKAWNDITVREALEPFPKYCNFYEQCKTFYMKKDESELQTVQSEIQYKSLEDLLYSEIVSLCELAFEQQFHYGIFYAWVKLKEQEIRNIVWISDMILMKRKEHIDNIVMIFSPRY